DNARNGLSFINNDFHLNPSSLLKLKGRSPRDFIGYEIDSQYLSPDFAGKPRTIISGAFSVGPYEYVP
ncbi:MAG TPA: hypothetical protein VF857_11210, partial [Spirochaetota bacterium]